MQTKTYFASSVPAALDLARKELGTDAMLLNSRPAPAESRAFGRLEVTFAYDPREPVETFHSTLRSPRPAARQPETQEDSRQPRVAMRGGAREIDELRRQVEVLRLAVAGSGSREQAADEREFRVPADPWPSPRFPADRRFTAGAAMLSRLVRNGISEGLAQDLTECAAGSDIAAEVARRIPVAGFTEMQPGEARTLALVGPAGRGKSTTLVKIALKYGIARRVPVRIYQAGGHGVGCQEQMARYAAILGVPFLACESLESLNLSLTGDGWRGLILIDTPGISPSNTAELQDFGAFFARHPDIERHLVLRADARSADMSYVISRYAALAPSRLLFTGVEETLTTGAMVETLITTGVGSSFSGTGQQIPDDLEELDAMRLARSVCGDHAAAAAG